MGGAWARRLRPRPAGEPVPCIQVRGSSSCEESPDVRPRREPSPTQPWPLPGAEAAGGSDGYDDSDMDWGGIDTGLTPSPPPDPGSPATDCTLEPPFPRLGVPFEYPEPEEPGRPPTPPVASAAADPLSEDEGLVVYVPAGVEDALRRRRELGETRPLPVPELHGLHTVVRAMIARWPSVSGLGTLSTSSRTRPWLGSRVSTRTRRRGPTSRAPPCATSIGAKTTGLGLGPTWMMRRATSCSAI